MDPNDLDQANNKITKNSHDKHFYITTVRNDVWNISGHLRIQISGKHPFHDPVNQRNRQKKRQYNHNKCCDNIQTTDLSVRIAKDLC